VRAFFDAFKAEGNPAEIRWSHGHALHPQTQIDLIALIGREMFATVGKPRYRRME
jgi:hypothetical protein